MPRLVTYFNVLPTELKLWCVLHAMSNSVLFTELVTCYFVHATTCNVLVT
jgi:hypothetical protein